MDSDNKNFQSESEFYYPEANILHENNNTSTSLIHVHLNGFFSLLVVLFLRFQNPSLLVLEVLFNGRKKKDLLYFCDFKILRF